jgi:hypothetical protein
VPDGVCVKPYERTPGVDRRDRAALDVFAQIQLDFASSSAYPEVKP